MQKKLKVNISNATDKLSQSDAELGSRSRHKLDEPTEERNNIPSTETLARGEKCVVEPTFSHARSFSLNHTVSADEVVSTTDNSVDHCTIEEAIKSKNVSGEGPFEAETAVTRMRSLSLNHTATADDGVSSCSLNNKKEDEIMSLKQVLEPTLGKANNKAHFITNMTSIAQEYVDADQKYKGYASKEEFIKENSKKYFFLDSSYPSMRLFEYEDDHGKYIEEEELWRPLPGDLIEEGNKHIEKVEEQNNLNNLSVTPEAKGNSDFEFSTIHCAQREPLFKCTPEHPTKSNVIKEQKEIIDLDPLSQPSQPPKVTPTGIDSSRSMIRGKRLFHDDADIVEDVFNICTPTSEPKLNQQVSPEVEYLGERSFNVRCNSMAATSDELYNAGLTLGSASVSRGKENLPPKRITNRSTFFRSPYEQIQRPIIEPNHVKLYEIITTLCDDDQYRYKYIINIDNCRVFLKQLGTSLKEDGWVEAWVINAFCRKLFKDNHPRKSQKHWFFHTSSEYFLEKWPDEFMKNKWREGTIKGLHGADSARKLHLSHRLFFPSLYEKHWFVFVVDLIARKFLFLDSYYGEGSSYHNSIDNMMIDNFRQTWNEAGLKEMGFENYDIFYPNVPKQKTPNDCGIFTMKYMEFYCPRNPTACSFSAQDVPAFRVQIAVDSVFNGYNSEIDNMYLISSFDLKAYKTKKT